ncbi:MAG: tRNA (adenosine(37)-N6)-threonylcarbamoyltransferase complex transferase subunit TsaD [Geminicoccaceae bacterium]|nr:MAG: tRNA (adenosine(37)-N6)-threonylcarbamoyltransferase complex transferase subunit TsaD [Geminicoccaceae bacterium]
MAHGPSTSTPFDQTALMLGLETSCDETAAALVRADGVVVAERVRSQLAEHAPFGGVVPEIAARAHVEALDHLIAQVMAEAGTGFGQLKGVAATTGPGLIGGLMVGAVTGKAIALAHRLPFWAINHLEGHVLTPRLVAPAPFPYLVLLVSGGHCQLVLAEEVGRYRRLGTTIDDAVGEAFDKVAKLLGLGYPGGPALERLASAGDPARFALPRPLLGRPGCHFSFSGLKTAVLHLARAQTGSAETWQADLAAGFQAAVAETLVDRTRRAVVLARDMAPGLDRLVVAGGVAANATVRARLADLAAAEGLTFSAPPLRWCGDNAAMIAWAALERARAGFAPDSLEAPVRARWPLDPAAEPAIGAGIKA